MQTLPHSEFWDFSLEVYERPEVSKLCLDLQDNYSADINMLLFACWLAQTGRGTVTVSAWRAMTLRLTRLREKVIKPLRSVRHILKEEHLAPEAMKQKVFEAELEAEHIEQLILDKEWGSGRRPVVSGSERRTRDMIENIVAYFRAEGLSFDHKLAYRCERLVKLISGLLDDKFIHHTCYQLMELSRDPDESRQDLTMP
ncbi:MAG: TIGR02444 family protein [Gammaproteobacteria bacterium]|nr:TIGR02444 family protein [Gammaproteobacteria bacterium]